MIRRQFPAVAIRRRVEPMGGADMPAQRRASKSAIEAHHVVTPHRATDRNCRRSRLLRRRDAPEAVERSIHLGNQPGELIDADFVMPHIAADNARDQPRIDLISVVLRHRSRPGESCCTIIPHAPIF